MSERRYVEGVGAVQDRQFGLSKRAGAASFLLCSHCRWKVLETMVEDHHVGVVWMGELNTSHGDWRKCLKEGM